MIRHFFVITFRKAIKQLNYSLINILGLSIGIASFILIMIYISDELRYDRFHENADNIYRVNRLYNSNDIDEDAATLSFPCGPALKMDYPDMIKSVTRLFDFQVGKFLFEHRSGEEVIQKFNEEWFYLADSTILKIFTFNFIDGDKNTALDRPGAMVISESAAKRWFGDENALGKVLMMENFLEFEITGVFKDLPEQSHMKIELLGSLSTYRRLFPNNQLPDNWIWNPCWTYIELADNVNPKDLELNFDSFYRAHYPNFQNQQIKLYLQKLTDIHLHSQHEYEMRQNSNVIFIRILAIIAVFVLVLACINFMNLTTASSAGRIKEISMKRVLGADRFHLTLQFLGEALVMTFIAYLFAAIMVELLIPLFNNFAGKSISSGMFMNREYLLFSAIVIIVVGLFSGSYPAFYLSNLSSARLHNTDMGNRKTVIARKVLVVVQFSVSIALIIATLTIYSQLKFLGQADLGFDKEQVIVIPSIGNVSRQYETFREELLQRNEISHVTGMEDIFGFNHNTRAFFVEGLDQSEPFYFPAFFVRFDFIETFGIKVVEGRSFSTDFPSDTSSGIMINEMMARNMGWSNEEAIGKKIRSDRDERVIGVFSDINAMSLHNPRSNFILDMVANPNVANNLTRFIAIRVDTRDYQDVIGYIEAKWYEFDPNRPFEYFFLDEKLNTMYKDEDKFSKISFVLTILAIVIACLGLLGLTSFLVEKKTKEICVRKIHGARLSSIQFLLSREYLFLILLANLLGWPAAFFATRDWLNSFSRHVEIEWYIFVFAGGVTLLIALAIILFHSLRAFMINPARSLRYE